MYAYNGLGVATGLEVTARLGVPTKPNAPPPKCVSEAARKAFGLTCRTVRLGCNRARLPPCATCLTPADQQKYAERCATGPLHLRAAACALAKAPVCAPKKAAPVGPVVSAATFIAAPAIIAPVAPPPAPPPPKRAPLRPPSTRLPVPPAEAAPVAPPPVVEPAPGVPTWVWLVGGVAVAGGAAYLLTRKKG